MMAPLPNPSSFGNRPELPRVRLDVRTDTGRISHFDLDRDEFLIGSAAGCDLRLSASALPAVALQLSRQPDGLRLRRVAPAIPVVINETSLTTNGPYLLHPGDTIRIAGYTITIQFPPAAAGFYLAPQFVPLDDVPMAEPVREPPPAPTSSPPLAEEYRRLEQRRQKLEAEEADRRAAWEAQNADLIRRQRELDRLAEELQTDQAQWHERRAAIEQELAQQRAAAAERLRRELEELRQQCLAECQRQREELQQEREQFRAEREAFEPQRQQLREEQSRLAAQVQELTRQRETFAADRDIFEKMRASFAAQMQADEERLKVWESELSARQAELTHREELLRTAREEFEQERHRFHNDVVVLERRLVAVEQAERSIATRTQELDSRLEQLQREAREWEETVRLATAEQERLHAEAERLDRQKAELDAQSALLAERAAQIEAQQAVVAVMRAKLERTRHDIEREAWQLAAARRREEEAQAELRRRIQEAEELRATLNAAQADAEQERRRLDERDSLLAAGLAEIQAQRDALAAEAKRLQEREAELDLRTAEVAEQTGMLKGRLTQALDLQSRLEADRVAIREREAALAQSEEARLALQEQLRRRSEELALRAKELEETARQLAAERAAIAQAQAEFAAARQAAEEELVARRQQLDAEAQRWQQHAAIFAQKEEALARQVARLKDVGAAVAAERKSLAEARAACEAERSQLEEFRQRLAAEWESLQAQAPELDEQTRLALERLANAREMLRGHLSELNEFARLSRADLETARTQLQAEAERIRQQHELLERAKDEHRVAVSAFRQQIIEWQGTIAEIRRQLAASETRLEAKAVAATEAATAAADATRQLAEETERLRREREELTARRTEMERHLADMREWYRKKLRELARSHAKDTSPELKIHNPEPAAATAVSPAPLTVEELEPGDRQLGELLQSAGLVDPDTLTALWAEAYRQRRTLRQVLLASGAITLYQLALIEAGNLDALVLGRFRVIDRLRVSAKEAVYRVFDPQRASSGHSGVFLLRHLGEEEMQDAIHPDEFRQRFSAARDAAHPHLAAVVEVLDINGRPAVVMEWLNGLVSADWPPFAAHPGCWVRLATMAAGAIEAAHRVGLVHGRLTSDSFLLTPEGVLKVLGFGEPLWLSVGPVPAEVSFAADLRAFGQVLFGWSQLLGKKRTARSKAFPETLWNVIRRLEADAEPPMADTVAAAQPYASAADLLADLQQIARETPFSDDAWERLLKYVADHAPHTHIPARKAG
jgi:chromosome segregation ATPase